jgi:hypothetical protein
MPVAAALPYITAAVSLYSAVSSKGGGQTPQAPAAPALPASSQAAQAPDEAAVRKTKTGNVPTGGTSASTFLTGPKGIDATTLNLGRNDMLGA